MGKVDAIGWHCSEKNREPVRKESPGWLSIDRVSAQLHPGAATLLFYCNLSSLFRLL